MNIFNANENKKRLFDEIRNVDVKDYKLIKASIFNFLKINIFHLHK